MSHVIVYAEPDGAARIVSPGPSIERAHERCVPKHARHVTVLDTAQLPTAREHRDAWTWDGQQFGIDPSRIPAPVYDAPAGASDTHLRLAISAELERFRQDVAAYIHGMRAEIITEIKTWQLTTQAAANALKKDAEVPTPELQAVREQSRAQLALLGDPKQVAEAIIAERDAEFRELVGRQS